MHGVSGLISYSRRDKKRATSVGTAALPSGSPGPGVDVGQAASPAPACTALIFSSLSHDHRIPKAGHHRRHVHPHGAQHAPGAVCGALLWTLEAKGDVFTRVLNTPRPAPLHDDTLDPPADQALQALRVPAGAEHPFPDPRLLFRGHAWEGEAEGILVWLSLRRHSRSEEGCFKVPGEVPQEGPCWTAGVWQGPAGDRWGTVVDGAKLRELFQVRAARTRFQDRGAQGRSKASTDPGRGTKGFCPPPACSLIKAEGRASSGRARKELPQPPGNKLRTHRTIAAEAAVKVCPPTLARQGDGGRSPSVLFDLGSHSCGGRGCWPLKASRNISGYLSRLGKAQVPSTAGRGWRGPGGSPEGGVRGSAGGWERTGNSQTRAAPLAQGMWP